MVRVRVLCLQGGARFNMPILDEGTARGQCSWYRDTVTGVVVQGSNHGRICILCHLKWPHRCIAKPVQAKELLRTGHTVVMGTTTGCGRKSAMVDQRRVMSTKNYIRCQCSQCLQ